MTVTVADGDGGAGSDHFFVTVESGYGPQAAGSLDQERVDTLFTLLAQEDGVMGRPRRRSR